jgi:hypothetical protein
MSVFTAFFCGTCSNSYDFIDGEVVSTLATHHAGREFVDWIICDGPGSGVHKSDTYKDLQEEQGRRHDGTQTAMMKALGIAADKAESPSKKLKSPNMDLATKWTRPGKYGRLNGMISGAEWEKNVNHALAVIRGEAQWNTGEPGKRPTPQALQEQQVKIFRKNRPPISTVNAIGWSRGAVTCLMLANALAKSTDERLNQIQVNIFAIDPVPGPGKFNKHRVVIPGNVKRYYGVYARHELQYIFRPSLPTFESGYRPEEFKVLLMPGVHASPSGDPYERKQNQQDSGKVTRHLAEDCLTRWGTPLNQRLGYPDAQLLKCYDDMLRHDPDYRGHLKAKDQDKYRKIRIGSKHKHVRVNLVDSFRTGEELGIFVNWHHREVFERQFRVVAERLFGVHGFRRAPSDAYRAALVQIGFQFPELHARLCDYQADNDLAV